MSGPDDLDESTTASIVAATRRWLELAVIGLNLCPFARPVANAGRIRYAVSTARAEDGLRHDLVEQLQRLAEASPDELETTLLIHPWVLQDFHEFNDFLAEADAVLEELDLVGTLQIASFHPHYQFAETTADDIANATNRSPFPTLHLLREASIEKAVQSMADPDVIYRRNIETMRGLGEAGWGALQAQFESPPDVAAHGDGTSSAHDPSARHTRDGESV